METIMKLLGSDITNNILCTAIGSAHKSIQVQAFEVIQAAMDGVDRPLTSDVLEQLLEVVNHTFDVCKKISINIELLQSNVARMATYGITIGVPQFVLRLLTNIETLTKSKYGHELHLAMHAIREKYTYNHMHNATSLQTILTELAGADGMRVLKKGSCPQRRNGAFRGRLGVFPSLDGGRRRLQLGIHQVGVRHHLYQQIVGGGVQTTRVRLQEGQTIQGMRQNKRRKKEGQL